MKKKFMNKFLPLVVCVVLTAALALTGCGNKGTEENNNATDSVVTETKDDSSEVEVLGDGKVIITLDVKDKDGVESHFEIHTDEKTVGDALVDVELVEGTVGEYGLMVESVDGKTLDYNKDGMYWAFLIDGEYATTGVDSTDVVEGTAYAFEASK